MKTRFSVQIDCLRQSEETLQRCYRQLNSCIDEMEAVRRRIANTMSADECIATLAGTRAKLEDQMMILWQMTRVLDRVAHNYKEAEHRLIRECEGGIKTEIREFAVNDFAAYKQEVMKLNLF